MQEFLQHFFGFIGILTVVHWVYKLFTQRPRVEPEILTVDDLMELRSRDFDHECPDCSSPLSLMRSTSLKECTSCGYKEEWKLNEGQLPLIANNRMVKKKQE